MGCGQVLVKVGVVLTVVAAYYLYAPLHPNLDQPVQYCILGGINRFLDDIGQVCDFLGIKELRIWRRDVIRIMQESGAPDLSRDPDVKITDTSFDGVPVRVYESRAGGPEERRGALLYMHGGGFLLGSLPGHDFPLSEIVRRLGIVVVSIDYRLAPEHPSPAAMEDCERVSRYLFSHADDWRVDPTRIGVGGDSAGGNMAAVLSLKFRDQGDAPQFFYQVLVYPWLQGMDFQLPSYLTNEKYQLTLMRLKSMVLFTLNYLGVDLSNIDKAAANMHVTKETREKYAKYLDVSKLPEEYQWVPEDLTPKDHGVDEELARLMEPLLTDPYNFPLMADSVGGVPPALVITTASDVLRDEGLLYLARLREEGVETQHSAEDTCWHGVIGFSDGPMKFECGAKMLSNIIDYIKNRPAV